MADMGRRHPAGDQSFHSFPGSNQQIGTLTWNPNGTLGQLQINDGVNPRYNQTCSYGHDDLGRLASVNCGAAIWQQNFAYDALGNITKTVPVGGTGISFNPGYGSGNHVNGFTYDAAGNVTEDNLANLYGYDVYGRPSWIVGAYDLSMTNDAFGRTVDWTGPMQAVYAPSGQKFAFMNGQTLIKYIVPWVAGMAAVHNGDDTGYWEHADWLGSSRLAHDSSGNVIYDRAYAPFGEPYNESATTNRDFTGQTQDTDPGLYDFLFRQQSHSQGRWLTPDPAGLAAVDLTNPQTWNRYAYLSNNPLNATDPLGLYKGKCGDEERLLGCLWGGYGDSGAMLSWGLSPVSYWGANEPVLYDDYYDPYTISVTVSSTFRTGRFNLTNPFTKPKSRNLQQIIACANTFANNYSIAAAFGAQNTFIGNALGGNIFSGIFGLGLAVFGNGEFGSADAAGLVYGGASLGIPIPGNHPGLSGAGGFVQNGIVKAGAQFGYNILTGGAQLSTEALGEFATVVGLVKFGYDAATYFGGAAGCALGVIH